MGSYLSYSSQQWNKNNTILVGTLNYGGILNSPFQFYSDSNQQQSQTTHKISNIFFQLIPKYFSTFDPKKAKKQFKWQIGKIDKQIQKRYTPIYNKNAGIQNNKLVTQKQFQQKWNQKWQIQNKKYQQKVTDIKKRFKSSQVENMRKFDLICYNAIFNYCYNKEQSTKTLSEMNFDSLDVNIYKNLMQMYFSRSYLDENLKIQKLMAVFNKNFYPKLADEKVDENNNNPSKVKTIDVLFFQQPTKKLINHLKNQPELKVIEADGSSDSGIIVVRSSKFKQIINISDFYNSKHNEIMKLRPAQNQYELATGYDQWPIVKNSKQTTSVVCDNYVFVNIHLSSKQVKNKRQVQYLKQTLNMLQGIKDDQKQYEILIGGDANSFINNDDLEDFYIFPKYKTYYTTSKKRTYLQPQFNKAEELITECKDHLISTLPMIKRGRMSIDLQMATDKSLLPTSNHPFDHFLVMCLLKSSQ